MRRACFFASVFFCSSCAPVDLCTEGLTPPIAAAPETKAHAHNDYEHDNPLDDALAQGFRSVEVDVWFRDGDIQVSHDAFGTKGTLKELYLDPLADKTKKGSVHGDGERFTLWIDLKDGTDELRELLQQQLAERAYFARFDDDGEAVPGPVEVILTGDANSKRLLIADTEVPRPFTRDSNDLAIDEEADATIRAAALSFSTYVGAWNGTDPLSPELARRCACAVNKAHEVGRRVRFFGGPDGDASWSLQRSHGADFLNADDLEGLHDFLTE